MSDTEYKPLNPEQIKALVKKHEVFYYSGGHGGGEMGPFDHAGFASDVESPLLARIAALERTASEHRDGRLAALERAAALEAELAGVRKDALRLKNEIAVEREKAETERMLQHAAGHLPMDWDIHVCIERDAGVVFLYHDGERVEFNDPCEGLAGSIHAAFDAALTPPSEKL